MAEPWKDRADVVWAIWGALRPPVTPKMGKIELYALMRWFYGRAQEQGVDPQSVDVSSIVDSKLTYDEAKSRLASELRIPVTRPEEVYAPPVRAPRPKVKPPLEFVCPKCGEPLARVTEITWVERVPVFEKAEPYDELPTGKFTQEVRTTFIPPAELIFMCTAGEPEYLELLRELRESQKLGLEKDVAHFAGELEKLLKRIRDKCPYIGMYFRVRDGRLIGPVPQSAILKQVMAPPPVARVPRMPRRPSPLEVQYEAIRAVEATPEYRDYIEKEVGMIWETYVRLDGWSKDALRREFASKGLKGL